MEGTTNEELVQKFEEICKELPKRLNGDSDEEVLRTVALDAAENATRRLRSPLESVAAQSVGLAEAPGVVVAAELGLFEILSKQHAPMSVDEVVKETGGEQTLVYRILRFLAAHRMIDQIDSKTYVANPLTIEYTKEFWIDLIRTLMWCGPAYNALPEHLRKNKYKNPCDPTDSAWQIGYQTKETFWQWLQSHAEQAFQFNNMMQHPRSRLAERLTENYPFEKLFAGSKATDVIFVDVGGGFGQQALNIRKSFGPQRGRVVLQDLPQVLEGKELKDIEVMKHDMMKPQPIVGARAYYFRGVLHDHSDDVSRTFLGEIKRAMSPESRLLIHEELVADVYPSARVTATDLVMMSIFSSMERSVSQMTSLLNSVGLQVIGHHSSGRSEWTIVEASL